MQKENISDKKKDIDNIETIDSPKETDSSQETSQNQPENDSSEKQNGSEKTPKKSDEIEEKDELTKAKEEAAIYKAKYKSYLIIALIALFTLNVIGGVFGYLFVENSYKNALEKASKGLYDQIADELKNSITYEVLKEYAREYYLPDNYTAAGLYVNQLARSSVVEIKSGNITPTVRATGVVLNEDGYVLTNAHVVTFSTEVHTGDIEDPTLITIYKEFEKVNALLYGSNIEHDMEIITFDPSLDLAIIKFKDIPKELAPISFTLSDYSNIGEETVAIGNALGLGISVTTGVVMGNFEYQDIKMIQTDTLALEGMSGAGVFNINAELLGIVSFKFTDSSNMAGVSFCLSSEEIIKYIDYLNAEEGLDIEYSLSPNLPEL